MLQCAAVHLRTSCLNRPCGVNPFDPCPVKGRFPWSPCLSTVYDTFSENLPFVTVLSPSPQGVCHCQHYISRLGQARMVQCGPEGERSTLKRRDTWDERPL